MKTNGANADSNHYYDSRYQIKFNYNYQIVFDQIIRMSLNNFKGGSSLKKSDIRVGRIFQFVNVNHVQKSYQVTKFKDYKIYEIKT